MLLIRIPIVLLLLTLAWLGATELRDRHVSGHLSLDRDPLSAAREALVEGAVEEATLLAQFARDTSSDRDEIRQAKWVIEQSTKSTSWNRRLERFAHGAVTGEPRDLDGFLGSLSLDLFLVGDIRDLVVQGYREVVTGDGDTVIMGLSAIGVATSLNPHLDIAPAILKAFRRAGALSERFIKSLRRLSRSALREADVGVLRRVVVDFGTATRKLGPVPFSRISRHLDDPADLARVSRAAERNPSATFSLIRLSNGRAIRSLDTGGATVGRLAKIVRRGARGSKLVVKATHSVPDLWLAGAVIGLLSVALLLVLGPIGRTVKRLGWNRVPVISEAVSRA